MSVNNCGLGRTLKPSYQLPLSKECQMNETCRFLDAAGCSSSVITVNFISDIGTSGQISNLSYYYSSSSSYNYTSCAAVVNTLSTCRLPQSYISYNTTTILIHLSSWHKHSPTPPPSSPPLCTTLATKKKS